MCLIDNLLNFAGTPKVRTRHFVEFFEKGNNIRSFNKRHREGFELKQLDACELVIIKFVKLIAEQRIVVLLSKRFMKLESNFVDVCTF